MSTPLDPTPRTPEEAEALERARKSLLALGALPDGVHIDFGFADGVAMLDDIQAGDAGVFVRASAYSRAQIAGTDLPVLPIAHVTGLEYIRDALIDGELQCKYFGMVAQLEGVDIPLSILFRLVARGREFPLFVTIDDAPADWRRDAMFRTAVAWPPLDDGRLPYIATGPMRQFETPLVVPPKFGRNSPCPCGSGKKAKRCCFG